MSIKYYDDALVEKIKKWTKDQSIQILRPQEVTRLLQIKADQRNDKPITLPFIALSRNTTVQILNVNKQPKTFRGYKLHSNTETTMTLNVIPISITYQLDIYTKTFEDADEYVRNFVFNFVNYPTLSVILPYNDANYEHKSTVWLHDNIEETSDVKERLFPDQFSRFTLTLTIDDAYLFSLPIKPTVQLEQVNCEVLKVDGETKEIEENEQVFPQQLALEEENID